VQPELEPETETESEIEIESDSRGLTGLAWPKTWAGAYLFVIASFILWLGLLTALTRLSS
jgi:hypothetical protein